MSSFFLVKNNKKRKPSPTFSRYLEKQVTLQDDHPWQFACRSSENYMALVVFVLEMDLSTVAISLSSPCCATLFSLHSGARLPRACLASLCANSIQTHLTKEPAGFFSEHLRVFFPLSLSLSASPTAMTFSLFLYSPQWCVNSLWHMGSVALPIH